MDQYNISLITRDNIPGISHPSYSKPYVICVNVERGAAVVTYHVYVGPFIVNVKVLNIDEDLNDNSQVITLGKGAYGSIIAQNEGNEQFVAKRIKFSRNLQMMSAYVDEIGWVISGTYL
jgi:hypothetical protein